MLGLVSLKKATFVLETKYNKNSNKSNCFYFLFTPVIAKLNVLHNNNIIVETWHIFFWILNPEKKHLFAVENFYNNWSFSRRFYPKRLTNEYNWTNETL